MARKARQTVDYFPHIIATGKTKFIFEEKYGNDGYAFLYKLFELLGNSNGHYIDLNNSATRTYMYAKMHLSEEKVNMMLDLLCELGKIDSKLYEHNIIWYESFVDNLEEVYKRRKIALPTKEDLCEQLSITSVINDNINDGKEDLCQHNDNKKDDSKIDVNKNQQSRVEESKVEESRKKNKDAKASNSPKKTQFKIPEAEDVAAYITEEGYQVDAEEFYNYYTSNGWKIGRNSMKDWKATVRMWNARKTKGKKKLRSDDDYWSEEATTW